VLALIPAKSIYENTIKLLRWQQLFRQDLFSIFSPVVEKGRTRLAYRSLQWKAGEVRNPNPMPKYPKSDL